MKIFAILSIAALGLVQQASSEMIGAEMRLIASQVSETFAHHETAAKVEAKAQPVVESKVVPKKVEKVDEMNKIAHSIVHILGEHHTEKKDDKLVIVPKAHTTEEQLKQQIQSDLKDLKAQIAKKNGAKSTDHHIEDKFKAIMADLNKNKPHQEVVHTAPKMKDHHLEEKLEAMMNDLKNIKTHHETAKSTGKVTDHHLEEKLNAMMKDLETIKAHHETAKASTEQHIVTKAEALRKHELEERKKAMLADINKSKGVKKTVKATSTKKSTVEEKYEKLLAKMNHKEANHEQPAKKEFHDHHVEDKFKAIMADLNKNKVHQEVAKPHQEAPHVAAHKTTDHHVDEKFKAIMADLNKIKGHKEVAKVATQHHEAPKKVVDHHIEDKFKAIMSDINNIKGHHEAAKVSHQAAKKELHDHHLEEKLKAMKADIAKIKGHMNTVTQTGVNKKHETIDQAYARVVSDLEKKKNQQVNIPAPQHAEFKAVARVEVAKGESADCHIANAKLNAAIHNIAGKSAVYEIRQLLERIEVDVQNVNTFCAKKIRTDYTKMGTLSSTCKQDAELVQKSAKTFTQENNGSQEAIANGAMRLLVLKEQLKRNC